MSNTTPMWFGSDERAVHCQAVASIPAWKRFLLCLLSYSTWSLARALGKSAVHVLYSGKDDEMFDRLVRLSDTQWSKVFNLPDRSTLLTRDEDFDKNRDSTY